MPARGDIRAFVAVDIPETACDALERVQDDLPVGRLMAPETLHLTLAFLGDQPADVVETVHAALCDVQAAPFELTLRGVDVFGGRAPKLLWAGANKTPELAALREKVRRAVIAAGVDLPRERFRPHVTLARFGMLRGDEMEKLRGFLAFHAGFALDSFTVDRFTFYRSILRPDGAMHDALAEYPLHSRDQGRDGSDERII